MKLVIFDHNLRDLGGHGYNYDLELSRSAKNFFNQIVVYHNPVFFPPKNDFVFKKLNFILFFSKLENSKKLKKISSNKIDQNNNFYLLKEVKFLYKSLNTIYYSIISLIREFNINCKLSFFYQHPSIEDLFAIIILSKIYKIIPFLKIRFGIVLRHTTDHIIDTNKKKYYIFKYLRKSNNIDFYTDSQLLTQSYKLVLGEKKITTLPIPMPVSQHKIKKTKERKKSFNIGVLGPPRSDKGFLLLPDIIKNLIKNSNSFVIKVFIQIDKNMGQEVAKTYLDIKKIAQKNQNKNVAIKFLKGPLSNNKYQNIFLEMDILLTLYNHSRYRHSTSGIFAESLIYNVPTISWENSWPAYLINQAKEKNLIIGETISDIKMIFDMIKKIKSRIRYYKKDLKVYSVYWEKSNDYKNIAKFLYENI